MGHITVSGVCMCMCMCRCESGDLTGKHDQLNISPDGASRPTFTYVDSNVQLSGNSTSKIYSVLYSIVFLTWARHYTAWYHY